MNYAIELDGTYSINSITDYGGPLPKKSDGQTVIIGGKTQRVDEFGCLWNSSFEWMNEEKTIVKMTSVADPKNANTDFLLTLPDGSPTSKVVSYEAELKVMRKGDKLQMTGTIKYGSDTVILNLRLIEP